MKLLATLSAVIFLATAASVFAGGPSDPNYDRLDGHGPSGKRVDVIEWEGNLEVHVYPAGSLKGLALKLDKRNATKPVMVLGFRFNNNPGKQLIRRAILGIPFYEGFKAYRDPSETEYDKVIISNNGLSGDLVSFRLDPPPTRLYPDGHAAALAEAQTPMRHAGRSPASVDPVPADAAPIIAPADDGAIRPFSW